MNLFAGIEKRETGRGRMQRPVTKELLEGVITYVNQLTLPEAVCQVEMRPIEIREESDVGYQPAWYLLFFVNRAEKGLDVGYMVGQAADFLRFQGIGTEILYGDIYRNGMERTAIFELNRVLKKKNAPKGIPPKGMQLAAALRVGGSEGATGKRRRGRADAANLPCIRVEQQKDWSEELLAFAKIRYPKTFREIHVSRRDRWIHFSRRRHGSRNTAAEAFEAGIAAANIMNAADELWVDLNLVKVAQPEEKGYLFSVCRKQDMKEGTQEKLCFGIAY